MDRSRSPCGALRACSTATRDGAINTVQWVAGNPQEKILLDLERARMEREDFRQDQVTKDQLEALERQQLAIMDRVTALEVAAEGDGEESSDTEEEVEPWRPS